MEIEFRAISINAINKGEFVYGVPCENESEDWQMFKKGERIYSINPKTIGQFTGLKDKGGKGNKVYKGDIFDIVFKDCPDGFVKLGRETKVIIIKGVVDFKFGQFCINFYHPEYKQEVSHNLFEFLKNEEKVVIGNIHQNIELLK